MLRPKAYTDQNYSAKKVKAKKRANQWNSFKILKPNTFQVMILWRAISSHQPSTLRISHAWQFCHCTKVINKKPYVPNVSSNECTNVLNNK